MTGAPEGSADQFEFDVATTVRDRGDARCFDFEVDAGWTVGPKPNGGYLLATAARAAACAATAAGSGHVHPLASTAHYLRAPDPGPAVLDVELLRVGRSATQARAGARPVARPPVRPVGRPGSHR